MLGADRNQKMNQPTKYLTSLLLGLGLLVSTGVIRSSIATYEAVFEPIMEINLRQDSNGALVQGRHVMIMFTKDGCSPCEVMKRDVLTDPEVQAYFKKNFLSYYVNIYGDLPFVDDTGVALTEKTYAKREGIWGTPAFHFFGENGKLVHKHVGGLSKDAFVRMGQTIAALRTDAKSASLPGQPVPTPTSQ